MRDLALKAENVVKTYGKLIAVNNLSFQVKKSSCFGILGPNGAGKTTMMKMLYGMNRRDKADGGNINVFGLDPDVDELKIKYLTGIVPQEDNLDAELNVVQNLKIYANFYGLSKKETKPRIEELIDFMELSEKKKEKIRHLSGGMKRRLVIARALLNKPRLLILDEPTTGLDPQVRHLIWDKMRLLKSQGVTIILTTHYMDEAYQLCDELILMDKGSKVLEGKPGELLDCHIEKFVLEIIDASASTSFDNTEGIRSEGTLNRTLLFSNSIANLEKITEKLKRGTFYLRNSNLEDLFLKITGRQLND
jgi:lipooligosaccharide transport system ATP-binding protein